MSFTFYKQLFYTTTQIQSFTAETLQTLPSEDYSYFFDRKDGTYAPGGNLTLDFGETTTVDAIIFDQFFLATITARYNSRAQVGTAPSYAIMNYYVSEESNYTNLSFSYSGATASTFFARISYISASAGKPTDRFLFQMTTDVPSVKGLTRNLIMLEELYEFSCNPDSSGYDPAVMPKEFIHKIGDGGVKKGKIANSARFTIKLDYVSIDEYNSLKTIYEQNEAFFFVHNPTSTMDWHPFYHKVNWIGDFEFERFQDSYKGLGYKGSIDLAEVPK